MNYIITDLSINKSTALRMAANHFLKNKRCIELCISGYDKSITISYRGRRSEENIKAGMKIERVVNK